MCMHGQKCWVHAWAEQQQPGTPLQSAEKHLIPSCRWRDDDDRDTEAEVKVSKRRRASPVIEHPRFQAPLRHSPSMLPPPFREPLVNRSAVQSSDFVMGCLVTHAMVQWSHWFVWQHGLLHHTSAPRSYHMAPCCVESCVRIDCSVCAVSADFLMLFCSSSNCKPEMYSRLQLKIDSRYICS